MDTIIVKKDAYFDSVVLMLVSREIKARPDVLDAVVGMATDMNVRLIQESGFHHPELEEAQPSDLIIAIKAHDQDAIDGAVDATETLLVSGTSSRGSLAGSDATVSSLSAAQAAMPDANLVVISVPGTFAAREARLALNSGKHVMLFSDNVTIEEEIELKQLARKNGLLLMGPDCGTAIVNGVPLCFANVVRRGSIGLAAASGTGLQEVSCLIDRFGGGITQAIGTGGRDLKDERVGGITMLSAIEALTEDPDTAVIAVVSKPPAPAVEKRVVDALKTSGKPCVAHFIGSPVADADGNVQFAQNLEQVALLSVQAAGVEVAITGISATGSAGVAAAESEGFSQDQRYLRGLFTGGTLADEALFLLNEPLGGIYSNIQLDEELLLPDPKKSRGHSIVDLGDDVFTLGAPHPMIDPAARAERLVAEAQDPETAVILMDLVLGYGSHADPAGAMADAIREAKETVERSGGYLSVVTSITGTPGDFQNMSSQRSLLEGLGCVVADSNVQASYLALDILRRGGKI